MIIRRERVLNIQPERYESIKLTFGVEYDTEVDGHQDPDVILDVQMYRDVEDAHCMVAEPDHWIHDYYTELKHRTTSGKEEIDA